MREIVLHDLFSRRSRYIIADWDEQNNPYLQLWAIAQNGDGVRDLVDEKDLTLMDQMPSMDGGGFSAIGNICARNKLIPHYGFAVPDEAALLSIKAYSPQGVLEIGAGTGYWSMLLGKMGVDVVAYEPWTGSYRDGLEFANHFPCIKADHKAALKTESHERTLLLCWPDLSNQLTDHQRWPEECLKLYNGKHVAYVGEGDGGCTGTAKFHEILDADWEEICDLSLPQWWGMHDRLMIYERRNK